MGRAANTRIKVKVPALLGAVETRRTKLLKDHEKALAKYERRAVEDRVHVTRLLLRAADEAEHGKLPERSCRSLSVPCSRSLATMPEIDDELERIDKLVQTLKLAAEPTIAISADDAAEYLG